MSVLSVAIPNEDKDFAPYWYVRDTRGTNNHRAMMNLKTRQQFTIKSEAITGPYSREDAREMARLLNCQLVGSPFAYVPWQQLTSAEKRHIASVYNS